MIVIWPFNGLCNRVRAISSAVQLGQQTGHKIVVFWVASSECGCRFDDLFEPHAGIARVIELNTGFIHRQLARLARALMKLARFRGFSQVDVERSFQDKAVWEQQARNRSLALFTHSDFYDPEADLTAFRPKPHLVEKLEDLHLEKRIGLHIRGQDNIPSKQNSPPEKFKALLDAKLEADSSQKFFLATDEAHVEQEFLECYGENLIIHDKSDRSRGTVMGIQDALIDLYALSRCTKIYGSHRSSFSEIAARMGNKPLEVVG